MKIEFCPNCPVEVRDAILPLLEKWKWIVPSWVHECTVFFVPDNDAKMSISVREYNRDILLHVYPDWLQDPNTREGAVVHEFCHCYNSPLESMAIEYLKTHPDYPTLGTKMTEFMLSEMRERLNCDLAALLMRVAPV